MSKRDIISAQRALRGLANFGNSLTWDDYEKLDKRLADARSELTAKARKMEANEEKVFLTMEFTDEELQMMKLGLEELGKKGLLDPYDDYFLGRISELLGPD